MPRLIGYGDDQNDVGCIPSSEGVCIPHHFGDLHIKFSTMIRQNKNKMNKNKNSQTAKKSNLTAARANRPFRRRMANLMEQKLSEEHSRLDLGPDGLAFAEMVLNPFGKERGDNPKVVAAPYPDGAVDTFMLTYTIEANINAGATPVLFCITPPHIPASGDFDDFGTANVPAAYLLAGNNPLDKANSSTSHTAVAEPKELAYIRPILTGDNVKFRIASVGISMVQTGNAQYVGGVMARTEGWGGGLEQTYAEEKWANTYHTYDDAWDNMNPIVELSPENPGMQVRSRFTHENEDFHELVDLSWDGALYTDLKTLPRLPGIYSCATYNAMYVHIRAVVHLEVRVSPESTPFTIMPHGVEPELSQLMAFLNSQDLYTGAHSFTSFIKKIANFANKTFNFADKKLKPIWNDVQPLLKKYAPELISQLGKLAI